MDYCVEAHNSTTTQFTTNNCCRQKLVKLTTQRNLKTPAHQSFRPIPQLQSGILHISTHLLNYITLFQSRNDVRIITRLLNRLACLMSSKLLYFMSSIISLFSTSLSSLHICSFSWILLTLVIARKAEALKCYETGENGVEIQDNDEYQFCVIMPSLSSTKNGTQFGLGIDNDILRAPDDIFGLNNRDYRILTFCIFEKYDFTNVPFYAGSPEVEFTFRCFCNYDLCNTSAAMNEYLNNLRNESYFKTIGKKKNT